jgi:hypothetical protein
VMFDVRMEVLFDSLIGRPFQGVAIFW